VSKRAALLLCASLAACSIAACSEDAHRRVADRPARSARADVDAGAVEVGRVVVKGGDGAGGHGHTAEEYAAHAKALKARLGRGYTVTVSAPFVIATNDASPKTREQEEDLVRWTQDKLTQDFFAREPARILDVLLFNTAETYEAKAIALFGKAPTTPYGYYDSENGALVMNIATGGGTLVHEMVHPFVEADFPEAPAWLNEGLGSLFEQSDERDGHIVGLPNWRLPALQKAITERTLGPLGEVLATTSQAFYEQDRGTNYAVARYLCYYLQERGLLIRFYKDFRARHAEDPTGAAILRQVLGEPDLAAFQPRWETFVMGLRFGRG
jgi:hypothetical protein